MKSVSNDYKAVMNKNIRNQGYISVGLNIVNSKAQAGAILDASEVAFWADVKTPFYKIYNRIDYATFEANFVKANGNFYFMPQNNTRMQVKSNGYVSKDINGKAKILLNDKYMLKGLTIDFGSNYPTEFEVETMSANYTYNNNSSYFICDDLFGETNYILITAISMSQPNNRLRINSITLGVGLTFGNTELSNVSYTDFVDGISAELSFQNAIINVIDLDNTFNIDNENSFVNFLEEGQTVTLSYGVRLDNNEIEWIDKASLMLSTWNSKRGSLSLTAKDKLAFLNDEYTLGNRIYTRTAYDEAEQIFTSLGLEPDEYDIDESLRDYELTNPMPPNTYAECLQLLCNSSRSIITQNEKGVLRIKANFEVTLNPEKIDIQTTNAAYWSKPISIFESVFDTYSDFSRNSIKADGSSLFVSGPTYNYNNTGYVTEVADSNGLFASNSIVTLRFGATFDYHGLYISFLNQLPEEFIITAYDDLDNIVHQYIVTSIDYETFVNEDFTGTYYLKIEITKAKPNSRVILSHFSFRGFSDYNLDQNLLLAYPTGYKDKLPKNVFVKINTYQLNENGEPELVDDNVWYKESLNAQGNNYYIDNKLISNVDHAQSIAQWIGNYYANNTLYDVDYRGDARVDADDIVYLFSDSVNNLQVRVEEHLLSFNGGLKGHVKMRKSLKLLGG